MSAAAAQVGEALPALVLEPVTKAQLVRYAGASKDFNPIHWDADFARQSGYPGPIAHGMLSMGFLGRAVTAWAGATAVVKLTARFKGITFPDDVLTISGEVTARRVVTGFVELDTRLQVSKVDGTVTTTGTATVRVAA